MKQTLLLLLLFVFLHGADRKSADDLFNKGEFQKAYDAYYQLFLVNPADPEINFYLGLAAAKLQKFDAAIAAFERVLIANPGHLRSHLELGRIYFVIGQYPLAKESFGQVLLQPLEPEVRKNIDRYMEKIAALEKRSYFNAQVTVGVLSDSNINNGNEFVIEALSTDPINPKKSDTGHIETVSANHMHDFGSKNGFVWKSQASLYMQSFFTESDYNLMFTTLETGLGYQAKGYTWDIPVNVDYLTLGGKAYLVQTGIGGGYQQQLSPNLLAKAKLKYFAKSHQESANSDRDANTMEGHLGAQWQFVSLGSVLNGEVTLTNERKVSGSRADVDFDATELMLGYFQPFATYGNLYAGVRYKVLQYSEATYNPKSAKDETRQDDTTVLFASYIYPFAKRYNVSVNLNRVDNGSTHDIFSYDKESISILLGMQF